MRASLPLEDQQDAEVSVLVNMKLMTNMACHGMQDAVQSVSDLVQDSAPEDVESQTPIQQFVDSVKDRFFPSGQVNSAQQAAQSVSESVPDSSQAQDQASNALQSVGESVPDTSQVQDQVTQSVSESVPNSSQASDALQSVGESVPDRRQVQDQVAEAAQSISESVPDSSQVKAQAADALQSVSEAVPDSQVQDQIAGAAQSLGQVASDAVQSVGNFVPRGGGAPGTSDSLLQPVGFFDFFNGLKGKSELAFQVSTLSQMIAKPLTVWAPFLVPLSLGLRRSIVP